MIRLCAFGNYISNSRFCMYKRCYNKIVKKDDIKFLNQLLNKKLTSNIQWVKVETVLKKLGATFEGGKGSRVRICLDGHTIVFHAPHTKSLDKGRIETIADFLIKAGVKEEKE